MFGASCKSLDPLGLPKLELQVNPARDFMLTATLACVIAALSSPVAAGQFDRHAHAKLASDWPQFGLDGGHSGYYQGETPIGKKNVDQLQLGWSTTVVQSGGIVENNGTLYADSDSDGNLYAVRAKDGSQLWSVPMLGGGTTFDPVPAVADKMVVSLCYGTVNGVAGTGLCGVRASDGGGAWQQICGSCGVQNSPSVDGRLAFYQYLSSNGQTVTPELNAVNVKTGKIVWQYSSPYHCVDVGQGGTLPVPVANGHVYAPLGCLGKQQDKTGICALEESNGTPDWCTDVNDQYASDLESQGTVYAITCCNNGGVAQVMAIDEGRGAVKWANLLPGGTNGGVHYAVANGILYVVMQFAGIEAISAKTGALLWNQTNNVGAAVTVANGVLYTYTRQALSALDAKTGANIWQSNEGNGSSFATPIIVGGTIYTSCYNLCSYNLP
jgi:outer membrane protein assembly factor BamB